MFSGCPRVKRIVGRHCPQQAKITLEEAYQESKRMQELVNFSPNNQLLYKTAVQLEGLPRHVSTHAAVW